MSENAVNDQKAQVTPAPATPAPQAETKPDAVTTPAQGNAEHDKKMNAAFAAMRKKAREAERELEALKSSAPPATAAETQEPPKTEAKVVPIVPAPKRAEVDIEAESVKAIEAISVDKDVMSVPNAILDIIDMVDKDSRLARLHNIDPVLAFREAKAIWASKVGVSAPPPMPKSAPISGGISTGGEDLAALVDAAEKATPGSKQFFALAKKIDAEMKKLHNM